MIFFYTLIALYVIAAVISILVLSACSIKNCVKEYRNRSNNCGDGAPEETEMGVVEDKEQDVSEGEDKDKESLV